MRQMSRTDPSLTANALQVLESRYLNRNAEGVITETPTDLLWRVATHVAAVEARYGGAPDDSAEAFYDAMARLQFLPNSPAGAFSNGSVNDRVERARAFRTAAEDIEAQRHGSQEVSSPSAA